MNYHLHITSVAQRDISQAADYIEFVLKNPKAADDLLEETDQKINALLPFPQEHPIVEDKLLAAWGIRFTQIKNYLAFYVIEENQVTVIRFLYAKSDWISILKVGFPLV
ncbi:type II toxin-antitoxin system RelE/ParE family toxin [Mediterraneibacter glycyrrhizinilyticus]|jgi:plasmid stabilization system protein ParE|uniref:type II toxin-antitoxin system RelE/ParE family toxin n=1 Tax=Mediterraneibacter glycyrrhizinilyticus TaxID=342942 RepID=UPI00195FC7FC|nr:type II toxin-antitoxin system RelE/ParE family toxin [Mediterraneibacter glycyrrhizinilyticus]MBM6802402.1 type II toxin-antitoxin system RelE/ParE family toxin [Mediterraneibacter glycyrrhizinilyticus]MDM8125702.1 type II toxin-antitoxin system RelE/ParE family toxin [Mediterraneibacter glycyrrhizinilyticus]MDM8210031.1 type II toxin-antitoxin system RelE/ParE family toxin [Mediterraneibacter glycyrrhizinilyticus]